jgi:hypothetical protein
MVGMEGKENYEPPSERPADKSPPRAKFDDPNNVRKPTEAAPGPSRRPTRFDPSRPAPTPKKVAEELAENGES